MRSILALPTLFIIIGYLSMNMQQISAASPTYVKTFLRQYNHYMAILKKMTTQIQWALEMGDLKGKQRKKAVLVANKASRYIRYMDRKAELLYDSIKESTNIPKDSRRQLMLINQVGTPKDLKHLTMMNKVLKIMGKIYSSARVRIFVYLFLRSAWPFNAITATVNRYVPLTFNP